VLQLVSCKTRKIYNRRLILNAGLINGRITLNLTNITVYERWRNATLSTGNAGRREAAVKKGAEHISEELCVGNVTEVLSVSASVALLHSAHLANPGVISPVVG
jgi:hypothetical protein